MEPSDPVTLPRYFLGTLVAAAEVRMEQYARHAAGHDPYDTDCILECDADEANDMEMLYREALEAYRAAVGRKG